MQMPLVDVWESLFFINYYIFIVFVILFIVSNIIQGKGLIKVNKTVLAVNFLNIHVLACILLGKAVKALLITNVRF